MAKCAPGSKPDDLDALLADSEFATLLKDAGLNEGEVKIEMREPGEYRARFANTLGAGIATGDTPRAALKLLLTTDIYMTRVLGSSPMK